MDYTTLLYGVSGQTAVITLNRPERMNAVIEAMYREISDALSRIEADKTLRCVILTGTVREKDGKRRQIFCAGADLKEHGAGTRTLEQKEAYLRLAHDTCQRIFEFPLPTLAVVNGAARGAGAEMALCCDFMFMADDATLAFPETGLGTCIGGGSSSHLVRLLGLTRAKDLVYTGRIIDGVEASAMGLSYRSVPVASLMDEALAFAGRLAAKAPRSMAHVKRLLQQPARQGIAEVLESETRAIVDCMKTDDWHEGVRAFAENRRPVYKGT
ncbi:enoyl-CoA hydratase [Desulfatiferula olefinivorans]